MFVRFGSKKWITLAIFPGIFPSGEQNYRDVPLTEVKSDKKETRTDFQRVLDIFKTDEFGSPSKELLSTLHTGLFAALVGGCVGGLKESQLKYESFVTKLNSEMFVSHSEAKNVLTRHMAQSFGKGFFHWGSRLFFFCSLFTLTTNMMSVYNEHLRVWHFVVSGSATGAIYRIPMGARAMVAASVVGGSLGLVAGCFSIGLFHLVGTSYDEIQEWHYTVRNVREQKFNDARDQDAKERHSNTFLEDRAAILKSAALEALQDNSKKDSENVSSSQKK